MSTDVTQAIKKRLREIDDELKTFERLQAERERLTRALSALGESGPAARRSRANGGAPARPRRAGSRRRGAKRAPRGSNQQAIVGHVQANPGTSAIAIAEATGIGRPVVYSALSRLTAGGKVTKTTTADGSVTYRAT